MILNTCYYIIIVGSIYLNQAPAVDMYFFQCLYFDYIDFWETRLLIYVLKVWWRFIVELDSEVC